MEQSSDGHLRATDGVKSVFDTLQGGMRRASGLHGNDYESMNVEKYPEEILCMDRRGMSGQSFWDQRHEAAGKGHVRDTHDLCGIQTESSVCFFLSELTPFSNYFL